MRSRQSLGQAQGRLVLADVAVLEAGRKDLRHARLRKQTSAFGRHDVALLQRDPVDPHGVRENDPVGLIDGHGAEFHRAGPSERSGFLRSEATISPMIETAISAGLTAPMSRPIGA